MARSLTLRANFVWMFLGNSIYSVCQWGILSLMAKLTTVEAVGQFSLALAVTTPIIMFCNLNLRAIQATDAADAYPLSAYLGLRSATSTVASAVICGLALFYDMPTRGIIIVVGFSKVIESLSDTLFGLLQRHEQMEKISLSYVVRGVLSFTAVGAVLYLTRNTTLSLLAMAGAWLLVLLLLDIPNSQRVLAASGQARRALLPRFEAASLSRLIRLSFPLGIVMLLLSLNTSIPRYVIEQRIGARALGIFSALGYFSVLSSQVMAAFGQAASPRLAQYDLAGNQSGINALTGKLLGLAALLGVGGVLVTSIIGADVLRLVYRAEYAEETSLFVILMIAAGVSCISSALGYVATATRRIRYQPVVHAVNLVVTLPACWFLAPYGLEGIGLAVVMSSIVASGGFVAILRLPKDGTLA